MSFSFSSLPAELVATLPVTFPSPGQGIYRARQDGDLGRLLTAVHKHPELVTEITELVLDDHFDKVEVSGVIRFGRMQGYSIQLVQSDAEDDDTDSVTSGARTAAHAVMQEESGSGESEIGDVEVEVEGDGEIEAEHMSEEYSEETDEGTEVDEDEYETASDEANEDEMEVFEDDEEDSQDMYSSASPPPKSIDTIFATAFDDLAVATELAAALDDPFPPQSIYLDLLAALLVVCPNVKTVRVSTSWKDFKTIVWEGVEVEFREDLTVKKKEG